MRQKCRCRQCFCNPLWLFAQCCKEQNACFLAPWWWRHDAVGDSSNCWCHCISFSGQPGSRLSPIRPTQHSSTHILARTNQCSNDSYNHVWTAKRQTPFYKNEIQERAYIGEGQTEFRADYSKVPSKTAQETNRIKKEHQTTRRNQINTYTKTSLQKENGNTLMLLFESHLLHQNVRFPVGPVGSARWNQLIPTDSNCVPTGTPALINIPM